MNMFDYSCVDFTNLDPNDYFHAQNIFEVKPKKRRVEIYNLTKKIIDKSEYISILENSYSHTMDKKVLLPIVAYCSILGITHFNEKENRLCTHIAHVTPGFNQNYFYNCLVKQRTPTEFFSIGKINQTLMQRINQQGLPFNNFLISDNRSKDIIYCPIKRKFKVIISDTQYEEYSLN